MTDKPASRQHLRRGDPGWPERGPFDWLFDLLVIAAFGSAPIWLGLLANVVHR